MRDIFLNYYNKIFLMVHLMPYRLNQLLNKFELRELALECNCHGTSAYVLGLFDELYWLSFNELKEEIKQRSLIQIVKEEDLKLGDLALYKNVVGSVLHSGVVVETSLPVIFSKDAHLGCSSVPQDYWFLEYGDNVEYLRLK